MSISDLIAVMDKGVVQQIGRPQDVYDSPVNLFVAKFLGTPPINVFDGSVQNGTLFIGEDPVLPAAGAPDGDVTVGIRPEGFSPDGAGPLCCRFIGVNVMGRDLSVISSHPAASSNIRAIISSESRIDPAAETVRFSLKKNKVFLFDRKTGGRIFFS